MTYDAADGYILLFGGGSLYYPPLNDTWAFTDHHWSRVCASGPYGPTCRAPDLSSCSNLGAPAGMTYDALDGYVLMVDCLGHTWSFSGGLWSREALGTTLPNAGSSESPLIAYDPADGYVVLFDSGQTWTYVRGNWTMLSEPVSPPGASYTAQMFYDESLEEVLLPSEDASNQTWAFHAGNWTRLYPPTELPGCGSSSSYDSGFEYGVVFGICKSSTYPFTLTNSTWVLQGGTWTNVSSTLPVAPAFRFGGMMTYDPVAGYTVLFGGYYTNGSYAWDYNDTWMLSDPLLFNLTTSPSAIDLGETSTLNVSVRGGVPPFIFNDSQLPQSCETVTVPGEFPCTPTSGGAEYISLSLFDALGEYATAFALLTVNPPLNESATVGPNPTTVGRAASFLATVFGGTPPVLSSWDLGDGTILNASSATHSYLNPGGYNVTFRVQDARGFGLTSRFRVMVNPTPVVEIDSNATVTDIGLPVSLALSTSGGTLPLSYEWSLGDGTASNRSAFNHTFLAPGTYSVNASVLDALGAEADSSINILVNSIFAVNVSWSTVKAPTGTPITFGAVFTGGTAPYSLNWTFGDGGTSTSTANPSHVYQALGNYTVTLVAHDSVGAYRTLHFTVQVYFARGPPPPPSANSTPSSIDWTSWIEVGAGIGVVALVAGVLVIRWRRSRPPA